MPALEHVRNKMSIMSQGHKLASEEAFRNKAMGVYLTPDLILSDGAVTTLSRLGQQGKAAVLCLAVRFSEEGFLDELKRKGALKTDSPLDISSRSLVQMACKYIHTETKRYEWNGKCFAELPISPYWKVSRSGLLFYSFSWAPLLVDYASIKKHDTSTFENWTLDGDYINKNFNKADRNTIHVVRDSDEITLISFTREADLHFSTRPYLWCLIPIVASEIKKIRLRDLFHGPIMDDLKREIFGKPVYMHYSDLNQNWQNVEAEAQQIINSCTLLPPTKRELFIKNTVFRLIHTWKMRGNYWAYIKATINGYSVHTKGTINSYSVHTKSTINSYRATVNSYFVMIKGWVAMIKGNPNDVNAPFKWENFVSNFILPYYRLTIRAPAINAWLSIKHRIHVCSNKTKAFFARW